jgi:hypothetical protein
MRNPESGLAAGQGDQRDRVTSGGAGVPVQRRTTTSRTIMIASMISTSVATSEP